VQQDLVPEIEKRIRSAVGKERARKLRTDLEKLRRVEWS
jgi:hypothetical protein